MILNVGRSPSPMDPNGSKMASQHKQEINDDQSCDPLPSPSPIIRKAEPDHYGKKYRIDEQRPKERYPS